MHPRPEITTEPTAVSVAEQFQNETLRPILKALNELLVAYFRHHLPKRKVPFSRLTQAEKLAQIERSIRDDTRLRLTLIGMVIGQFTPEEFDVFTSDEAELTRRIANLISQRLQSQVEEI
jgi:hypothetical protein